MLITAGVFGFGALVEHSPWIGLVARYGGATFLLGYALIAFRSAWRGGGTLEAAERSAPSWQLALATCLALTWLNPHVYLDTLVLLGAASVKYETFRTAFATGAVCASFLFFFSLGYGARLLQPLFARPIAWRILDLGIGMVMLSIAASLLR